LRLRISRRCGAGRLPTSTAFWQSVWDYFDLRSPTPHSAVLADRKMPGAVWFPGASVNYARQVFRHVAPAHAAGLPALICERRGRQALGDQLARAATQIGGACAASEGEGRARRRPGRGVLAEHPETIIAFLATASLGAIWSVCAPDMAAPAVIDRFKQIEPKVLIACDAVTYAGRAP
jgi:acetoacetyl-CoA synthetase